jgi:hypothetical protein
MALTSGLIAASATPATDLYTQIATKLTAKGWTEETTRTYTASIMGTTANCKVWTSAATTVASSIYTGTILSFEVDDANSRIRMRVCEKFDASLSGAAALNTKWAPYGGDCSSSVTVTANYGNTDSFVSHFQTANATQSVAWIEIPVSASGFNYWVGATASIFLMATNAAGLWYAGVAGKVNYQGDLNTSVTPVFLAASTSAGTTVSGSWNSAASSSNGANSQVRVSREPGAVTAAAALCFFYDGVVQSGQHTSASGGFYGGPGAGAHKYYQNTFVTFPTWFHGWGTGSTMAAGYLRSNFATLPDTVLFINPTAPNSITRANFPNIGETVTVSGASYTCLGIVQMANITTSAGSRGAPCALLVLNSAW